MVYEAFVAKTFFLVLGVLGLAVSALGLILAGVIPTGSTIDGGSPLLGWIFTGCFWGMSGFFFFKAFDRRPHLRIDENGLRYRLYSNDVIPWDELSSCQISRVFNQRIIGLNLHDPEAYPSKNALTRASAGVNRAAYGDVAIAATNLSGGPEGVLQAIAHYRPDLFR